MNENQVVEIAKRIFISYSWTTPKHEKWVLDLAERLMNDGVHVVLDKWDLKQGQDKYVFMEQMVQDNSLDKVLIICDKGYKEKADERTGGVGTETQIISPALYGKISETKFIPIIAEEGDKEFDEYMPNYIKSRIGIVMSSPESYINGYEELLRVIYDKPRYKKPKIGKKPSFLNGESKLTTKLYFINELIKKHIDDNRNGLIEASICDFREAFFEELDSFIIDNSNYKEPYDDVLINYIDDMKPLRDEYLFFIENLIVGYDKFNSEIVVEIFEKLYGYKDYKGAGDSYINSITEHYEFLITELFIWTNIILLKHKKYELIKEILYTRYFVDSKFERGKKHFSQFRFWLQNVEARSNRLGLNRLSITADKLIERVEYKNKNYKNELVDTDLILYYVSKISGNGYMEEWFPITYIYKNEFGKISLIEKMARKKHFDAIKIIFDVENKEELITAINEKLSERERGYHNSFSSIPLIQDSINLDEIGMY